MQQTVAAVTVPGNQGSLGRRPLLSFSFGLSCTWDAWDMDKNGPSAQRVYYWRPEIRALLCLVWAALAVFFLFGLVAGIDYQINHPESRWPPMGQFFGFAWLV